MPNYTILLVDYEPRSVERTRRPLVDAGFKVHLAPDGVAALDAFERLKPDLVLIEAMLPKKNGFEVCQELRQKPTGKSTPILITTAVYRGRKYRSQALHVHGASEYIEKPIADDQLVAIVRRFLQGSSKRPARAEETAAPVPEPSSERAKPAAVATPPTPPTRVAPAKAPVVATVTTPTPVAPVAVSTAKPASSAPAPAMAASTVAANTPSLPQSASARSERSAQVLVAEPGDPMPAMPGAGAPGGLSAAATATWRAAANAMTGGLTEDEISERLDALLPLGLGDRAASATSATDRAEPDAFDLEAAADVLAETDPDFDAGSSMDEAILIESAIPTVPAESTDIAERPTKTSAPADDDRPDADVVRFDARRSKKRKKSKGKLEPTSTVKPPAQLQPPPVMAQVEPIPLAMEPRSAVATPPLPSTSKPIETYEAPPVAKRRSIAIWVWLLVLAAVAAGVYYFFFQDGFSISEAPTSPSVVEASNTSRPSRPAPATPEPSASTTTPEELGVDGASTDAPAPTSSSQATASEPTVDAAIPASNLADRAASTSGTSLPTAIPAVSRSSSSSPSMKTRPAPSKRNGNSAPSPVERASSASFDGSPAVALPAIAPAATNSAAPPESAAPPSSAEPTSPHPEVVLPEPGMGVETAANHLSAPPETASSRAVREGDLVPLAAADQPPIALSRPAPAYPKQARADGQEGEVSLSLLIDETGKVSDLRIVNAANDEFGSAASKVVRTWTYKPAMKNGVRIKVWKPERVIFKL